MGKTKVINITPTWVGVARSYVMLMERGTPKGKENARRGIIDMGRKLDELNELAKKGKLKKVV